MLGLGKYSLSLSKFLGRGEKEPASGAEAQQIVAGSGKESGM